MTHQQIIEYSLRKPGAYLDDPFRTGNPVVRVKTPSQQKGRIFVQTVMLRGEASATFACRPDAAEFYRNVYPGAVTRGWHCPPVQQPHFNTVRLNGDVPDDEIFRMIDHAYTVTVGKMPKYIRNELQKTE